MGVGAGVGAVGEEPPPPHATAAIRHKQTTACFKTSSIDSGFSLIPLRGVFYSAGDLDVGPRAVCLALLEFVWVTLPGSRGVDATRG